MRDIKFRAWDTIGKRFIRWDEMFDYAVESVFDNEFHVLEQFTGLKDKNGLEIYEGDFIKAGNDIMRVVWSGKHASFGLGKAEWAFMHFFAEAVEAHRSEVIGNIHENPELIK